MLYRPLVYAGEVLKYMEMAQFLVAPGLNVNGWCVAMNGE